ncbi:TIGR03668 family PPOX class F420-dependent oxidoreductase [Spongiactinospora sp. TRM90649]|uniref:TIGR03668 family PPOX class F420-dependent oxidoreductase n=1 Tax=Spongiactinospora sp. TRM90649 TaxID=3031114 RepID=UPI0023F85972|nr:TIGR03668 family PPOX class F420-dependent oxidoreductase [Spongiactinospora sp. TRM90649]MDF5757088.1 TIGR03668 family PPOX class F420-dependent oxidoreductase [Spongiactinospora sp. TRM90649]
MDPGRARALFAGARVARLATVRPDGTPRLVPVTFAVRGDVIVTAVDHKPKTTTALGRLADIAANPRVCLLADHYDDDWERLWWARADGPARVVEGAAEERSWLVEKYAQYRERPPAGPAVLVEVGRWSGWTAAR